MFHKKRQEKPKRHILLKGVFKLGKGLLAILALPAVRDFLWSRATGKAQEKIVDVEAKVVGEEGKEDKKLFG